MFAVIKYFRHNVRGATAIEYGLIAALMSVALIAALPTVVAALKAAFGNIATNMTKTT